MFCNALLLFSSHSINVIANEMIFIVFYSFKKFTKKKKKKKSFFFFIYICIKKKNKYPKNLILNAIEIQVDLLGHTWSVKE